MRILVSGGAGFIGSNFIHYLLRNSEDEVVVIDKLTHAGIMENLDHSTGNARFRFLQGDIADPVAVREAMAGVDAVVNFAAESHVDRSILDPDSVLGTNVYGAFTMLEAARSKGVARFVQVSTDEVYGEAFASSSEDAALRPRNPYSASKAAADLLAYAYHITYGLPTVVTRGSNNFGPYQYPDRLIPVVVTEAIDFRPVPIYGDGRQIRDWLFVEDHCSGIDVVMRSGEPGEAYNIGGGNLRGNLEVVEGILELLGRPRSLIEHVPDRPGHDRGYSVDSTKLLGLGWNRDRKFEAALADTVRWYVDNEAWWRRIKASSEYQTYFRRNYEQRDTLLSPS